MTPEFLRFYRKLRECYGELILHLKELGEMMDVEHSLNEQADRVYALRESEKVMDDLLKEIKRAHNMQQKLACIVELTGIQDSASSEYCTGQAKEQKILSIPHKRRYDPENFDKLMADLGIPENVYLAELVRPNWPACHEHYNNQLGEGRNIPIEVKDEMIYKFTVRKKKGLDSDE